jgi:hypothetical protein
VRARAHQHLANEADSKGVDFCALSTIGTGDDDAHETALGDGIAHAGIDCRGGVGFVGEGLEYASERSGALYEPFVRLL